ncbi:PQQ-dependent sugar dehydrogenase [Actinophytocola gossypii]|uniref:PQQ-dependent sugar dehydrogenase n=1 Tax=Actinophytocola gossypii TaxID=2812003 RepID=A0ABT2J2T0_9PSEU|nr:PQQ-dependent sugar dehydrogenase [Actinophytocola gossypii]MCT2582167.1 PQQ-dependent sugar dehydrogenase [Actinophytocola gossypii]
MRFRRIVAALVCVLLSSPPGGGSVALADTPVRTIVDGLRGPWAIAFLPGGDALVTERDTARLLRVTPAGAVSVVGVVPGVVPRSQGGLLGVAVSPRFTVDRTVYAYVSAARDNRIVRFRYDKGIGKVETVLAGIPVADDANGGRLKFGPDGMLYATTGYNFRLEFPQDPASLGGKILRMTPDGRPAPGNPFPGSVVWTLGHRNIEGIAWDALGRAYATEFGAARLDELNRIRRGHNYGWPHAEGPSADPRFTDPELTWRTGEASPSGVAFAGGSLWVAALGGERLWEVPLGAGGRPGTPVPHFVGTYGRIRAVAAAPGGALWLLTSNTDGVGTPRAGDDRLLVLPPDFVRAA